MLAVGFAMAWYHERQGVAPARVYVDKFRSTQAPADPFNWRPGQSVECTISGYPVTITVLPPEQLECRKTFPAQYDHDDPFGLPACYLQRPPSEAAGSDEVDPFGEAPKSP